ncbi:hypothetical protein [Amycolatopsis nigrescens]|uniref:hypothetical protein n=1 Tax=Amycolatopsis nigrescens TaxID=381445 RepID=UPI000367511A|nr:hypothetical protein [Amycolatopsis nigrescens]
MQDTAEITKEFFLPWTIAGGKAGRVTLEICGQVELINDNKHYKVTGLLYVADGGASSREIGNPLVFVQRNIANGNGRRQGWQVISGKKTCERLHSAEMPFARMGHWGPEDRTLLLNIGAVSGWTRRTQFSSSIELRLVD